MYYPNDKNNMYHGVNFQRNNSVRNPRYYDYSRNVASRNSYVPNHDYAMPSFYRANSNAYYDTLTRGPLRRKGAYKFN